MNASIDSLLHKIDSTCSSIKSLLKLNDFSDDIEAKCEKKLADVAEILARVERNLSNQVKENQVS
jgi:hypothetical protein